MTQIFTVKHVRLSCHLEKKRLLYKKLFPLFFVLWHILQKSNMQTTSAIVIDNGSGTIKAGLNSDVGPKVVFPTVAGYTTNIDIRTQSKKTYIGDEVWEKEELLSGIKNPIKRGVVSFYIAASFL